jgi:precorrin-6B C5,15-methyltransferase / cobalt-precorrin-6B C5,C15-methyltransferase
MQLSNMQLNQQQWMSVIGIGDGGMADLTPVARSLLAQAAIVVGGKRHLAMLPPEHPGLKMSWAKSIDETILELRQYRGQPVSILASGDPMCYGVGSTIARYFPIAQMQILPMPSAFSLACARLGWSQVEVEMLSLCGRPIALLQAVLYPGAKILLLSADRTTPRLVIDRLKQRGYGATQITILEHLGGVLERQVSTTVDDFDTLDLADLNTIALQIPSTGSPIGLSRLAGLPDELYQHDGQLTKREVRAITLASLAPLPGQMLWDVGGGAGSIAIEWMRSHPRNAAITIEQNTDRLVNIATNAAALGVPNLQIIAGKAPTALVILSPPDAVFIGGGLTMPGVFEACWQALRSGGRLVANGVTVETEQRLFELQRRWGGSLSRIAIQRAEPVGKFLGWRGMAAVTQWVVIKS